jgi:HEAT repeat protein
MEKYKDILDQLFVHPPLDNLENILDKLALDIIPELLERCRSWPSTVTVIKKNGIRFDPYHVSFNYRISDVFAKLGNNGYEIVPLLIGYLNDENESDGIRLAAAHSLLRLGEDVSIVENQFSYLLWATNTYAINRNYHDFLGIVSRIFGLMGESPVIRLRDWMTSEDPKLRYLSMGSIVWTGDSSRIAFPLINKLLQDKVDQVHYHAIDALQYILPRCGLPVDKEILSTLEEIDRTRAKEKGYSRGSLLKKILKGIYEFDDKKK